MSLFQSAILRKYLKGIDEKIAPAYKQFASYFHNPEIHLTRRMANSILFVENYVIKMMLKKVDHFKLMI
jgi:hypothetical protein